jgi:hypothetical protein
MEGFTNFILRHLNLSAFADEVESPGCQRHRVSAYFLSDACEQLFSPLD